jgi:4-hydroxy-4-methyl-2-oxoglutarate aldolase
VNFTVGDSPLPSVDRADALETLRRVSTGTLGHLTDFGYARGLEPLHRPAKAVGPAYTVNLPQLDGVAVHFALSHIAPGDVLVIATGGEDHRAYWGGVTAHAALTAGVAAVVVDGPINDWEEVTASGVPVWCNGRTCPVTGRKLGLEGSVQVPVQVGGAVVQPGDYVLADSDGVFFIPPDGAVDLARRLEARESTEPDLRRRLDDGERLAEMSGAGEMVRAALDGYSRGSL